MVDTVSRVKAGFVRSTILADVPPEQALSQNQTHRPENGLIEQHSTSELLYPFNLD